ncbi:MAG: LacI family DNA-binding transcriptional regulator [Pseudomonadota bacterium]
MLIRPTIRTVAEQAGVSVSTVSQVMRGHGRISKETRRKVLRVAEQLNYVRDRRAVAMRSGESSDIGFLINNIANPFNAEVVAGVNACLADAGFLVHVLDGQDDPVLQERYLRTMIGGGVGGLLWVPANGTMPETVDWVKRASPATLTLLRSLPDLPFDHVGVDNSEGIARATQHLLDLGHRRIAFLGGDRDTPTLRQRIGGYLGTMMAGNGHPPIVRRCEETKTAAKDAAIALCQEHPDVSALVCNCDVVALGSSLGVAELGHGVGRDISITGFDGIEDARLWVPPLTTVEVDPKGLGQQLADAFLARRANAEAPLRSVTLPVRLAVRASSGPPNGEGRR